MRSGMRMVMMRKLFARMRSRYSRFATSQTLSIDIFSYGFDEDLLEGGFHDFEAGDAGAALDGAGENEMTAGDEGDGVADFFDLVHAVGAEEDGLALLAEVD